MALIEILKSILFGIIEGITEWLPISSTGHLILLNDFVKLNCSDEFLEMFNVVIQLGAIMAVVLMFWNKLWPFTSKEEGYYKRTTVVMWMKIIVACIPTIVIGLPLDNISQKYFYNGLSVAIMLVLFGVAFIIIENRNKGKEPKIKSINQISFLDALIIGCFQLIAAIFPGTSRSGATIVGSLLIGVSRPTAAQFTFFLAVPAMAGASLLKIAKFVISGVSITGTEIAVLFFGCIVSFVVSVIAIKYFLKYIRRHDFKIFGYYRIILGAIVFLYFIVKLISTGSIH
ncbi:MAG: undecaprenyl-diphosphate phosphatase [Ruminococcaceae bacterium]|nr:undecaprenyl-diphosphate phosphatase [Oscillospiraceae bacterium]